jgi:hypothetical protein
MGDNFFITPHDWYFFTLPDQVTIESIQLFFDPDWTWQ